MFQRHVLIALSVTALAACDNISEAIGGEPDGAASASRSESRDAPSTANAGDTKLAQPTISMPEAMELSVFDITPDMPVDEVKASLLEKGFEEPTPSRGEPLLASIGFACDVKYGGEDYGPCDIIGQVQETGFIWTRGPAVDGKAQEQLLPLFYVDENKTLRLWHIRYERAYDPKIFPGAVAEQMLERYGEPSFNRPRETRHGLTYYLQMEVPEGYERTETDERGTSAFNKQRAIKINRIGCLEQEIENFPAERTKECASVLQSPSKPQFIFDGLSESSNLILEITIRPENLRLQLTADFLHRAVALHNKEIELNEQLAELARRRDAGADVADDL